MIIRTKFSHFLGFLLGKKSWHTGEGIILQTLINMPTYKIRGVDVDFPFEAYDCQLVYMDKVIQSLQEVSFTAFLFPLLKV